VEAHSHLVSELLPILDCAGLRIDSL